MLSVRELQAADIERITDYWLNADDAFLITMGVDLEKMPSQAQWIQMLEAQLTQSYSEKQSYCTIWEIDGQAVGHCNVNKIKFGAEAYLHLHLWQKDARNKGAGAQFVRMSLPYFFENLCLQKILSEPYKLNLAPNKTLAKAGFQLSHSMVTTPGWINFEQEVNVWVMDRDQFMKP